MHINSTKGVELFKNVVMTRKLNKYYKYFKHLVKMSSIYSNLF